MKTGEMIAVIARELVDNTDKVKVKEVLGDKITVIELAVDTGDVGKVIGKKGKTASALRHIVQAIGAKQRRRTVLEIIE